MNHTSKLPTLPALTTGLLLESGRSIDNVFAKPRQQVGIKTLLSRCRFNKRSAPPIHEVIYPCTLVMVEKRFYRHVCRRQFARHS